MDYTLSSTHRAYGTSAEYTVNLERPIQGYSTVALSSFIGHNRRLNITDQKLYMTLLGQSDLGFVSDNTFEVQVPQGYYNTTNLATALNEAIVDAFRVAHIAYQDEDFNVSCSYDSAQMKFTISCLSELGRGYQLAGATTDSDPYYILRVRAQSEIGEAAWSTSLNKMLGYDNQQTFADVPDAAVSFYGRDPLDITSDTIINLHKQAIAHVGCSIVHSERSNLTVRNLLSSVPLGDPGSSILYEKGHLKHLPCISPINTISIRLYDSDYQQLDLQSDHQITLRFEE